MSAARTDEQPGAGSLPRLMFRHCVRCEVEFAVRKDEALRPGFKPPCCFNCGRRSRAGELPANVRYGKTPPERTED